MENQGDLGAYYRYRANVSENVAILTHNSFRFLAAVGIFSAMSARIIAKMIPEIPESRNENVAQSIAHATVFSSVALAVGSCVARCAEAYYRSQELDVSRETTRVRNAR